MKAEEAMQLRCKAHLRILSPDRMQKSLRAGFTQKHKRQFALKGCKGASSSLKPKLLELAFNDTFVKIYQWSSILQAYSRVLHDQNFPKRAAIDVYCNG